MWIVNTLARRQTPSITCQHFDHFEKIQENLRVCSSIDIYFFFTSTAVFGIKPFVYLMTEENSKSKRKKPRRPCYDDKEYIVLLELVKKGKAYSEVQHDKRFTSGMMLELQRTVVNQS